MLTDIMSGKFDNDLDSITKAVSVRQGIIVKSLSVGSRVRLTNVSPKYLDGVTGVITAKVGDKISVEIDSWCDTGRYSRKMTAKPSMLRPV